jgi:F-type H+/Na+-transporting ATPase subunit alpha
MPVLGEIIRREAEKTELGVIRRSEGVVLSVGDGIASVEGLYDAGLYQLLEFPGGVAGIAFDLEPDRLSAVLLDEAEGLRAGGPVRLADRTLSVPVGDGLIGRAINPLGRPLDGLAPPEASSYYPLERPAPGVVRREFVSQSACTGIRAIDSMLPIGRGQRELIIGDTATGKTAIVVDAIINQRHKDMLCVYVAVGQKVAVTLRVIEHLRAHGAMEHTVVVCAGADTPLGLQYAAPYAGCAIAEYFFDKGRDVLVIYDDLTKHAEAYRALSLLLRRPPGREAYPGDIFYLHSRLLERSAKIASKYGGASITALPIVETQSGRISGYIPTNLISITDGQIYLDSELFDKGIMPAIDIRKSVSRVGGRAQLSAMREVCARLRIDYDRFLEVEVFTKFGARLDAETLSVLARGNRLREMLRQPRFVPMEPEEQVALFYAYTRGHLDGVEVDELWGVLDAYLAELRRRQQTLLADIRSGMTISSAHKKTMDRVIKDVLTRAGKPDNAKPLEER